MISPRDFPTTSTYVLTFYGILVGSIRYTYFIALHRVFIVPITTG